MKLSEILSQNKCSRKEVRTAKVTKKSLKSHCKKSLVERLSLSLGAQQQPQNFTQGWIIRLLLRVNSNRGLSLCPQRALDCKYPEKSVSFPTPHPAMEVLPPIESSN